VQLTVQQAYEFLAKHGVFVRYACDKCGRLLGAVRYMRRLETGEWCSRECRGQWPAVLKTGRPRKYRNGKERRAAKTRQQQNYRSGRRVEKTVCSSLQTQDLRTQKWPLSTTPLAPSFLHR